MIRHTLNPGRTIRTLIILCLFGCSSAPSSDLWAVFPERSAEQLGLGTWAAPEADLDGYWSPSEEDILNLEGKLDSFLRENADQFKRQPPVWEQLDQYKRQYVGVVVNGKQIIHGNFFCNDAGMDWKKDWVFVMDGGDCFFQLQYDVESETFLNLSVNGEA